MRRPFSVLEGRLRHTTDWMAGLARNQPQPPERMAAGQASDPSR